MRRALLCDFHIHTTFSDGEMKLKEVIDLYGINGLSVTFFRWSFYAAFFMKYSSEYPSFGNMLSYNRFLSRILCASQ